MELNVYLRKNTTSSLRITATDQIRDSIHDYQYFLKVSDNDTVCHNLKIRRANNWECPVGIYNEFEFEFMNKDQLLNFLKAFVNTADSILHGGALEEEEIEG